MAAASSSKILLRLVGPLLLIFFLVRVGPERLLAAFVGVRPELFLAAAALAVPSLLVKGVRWQQLLRTLRIELGLVECTGMYAAGMALGTFTPGQLGEFSKVWQVAEGGHGYLRSLLASLLDRGLDVLVLVGLGVGGLLWYSGVAPPGVSFTPRASLVLAGALLAALVAAALWRRLGPATLRTWWQEGAAIWREPANRGRLARVLLATVLYVCIQYGSVYLCVVAVGAPIALPYLVFVFSLTTLVASLPVTVAGIGTRDALFFYYFSRVGVPAESCLVLSSLVLGLKVANGLLLYLLAWLIDRRLAAAGRTRP
jgi:uncharacterized membrane protein YbhN (UPF0104 family)